MLEFLEVEEFVGRRWHRWASRAASYPEYAEAAVHLDELSRPLGVLFRASGGDPGLTIEAIGKRASRHRLSWRQRLGFDEEALEVARRDSEHLLLPPRLALLPECALNLDLYRWLVMFLAEARPIAAASDPLVRDLASLAEARRCTEATLARYPGFAARHARLCRALLKARPQRRGLPPAEAAVEALVRRLLGDDAGEASPWWDWLQDGAARTCPEVRAPKGYRHYLPLPLWGEALSPMTLSGASDDDEDRDDASALPKAVEVEGAKRKAERHYQDQAERDDPLMLNASEKMLSWAEMVNVNRQLEDEDEEAAREAADQLDEITLSRHQRRAASRLNMSLELAPHAVADKALVASQPDEVLYPEWNYRKGCLLADHCRVIVEPATDEAEPWQGDQQASRRVRKVRRQFEALRPRREWLRGQAEGDELDLDALVRCRCDLAAGSQASDRLFVDSRPQGRDLAVSILIDVSLSTDAWLDSRRVIDVAQEALMVLGHGIADCGDDVSIHSFTSQRRHRVWVRQLKGFDEPMGERVERRISALTPGHYTRMGPAIRHLAKGLVDHPRRHRLVLVLTDGKPNDTDYYEGRYAIEDTRHAVREAMRDGVRVFAVTIDREASRYLSRIFGRSGYAIVPRPEHLALALPGIYRQLVAQ
ncbi:nitric oxide reductase activation protein NorD [Halomonas cupida]|uniref:nitric oxide reductase activation protein NorD n=1 Tax=Halomonas TaxID=2745 RepID=UPI001A8DF55D|nr:VWA domain-containing protein [Halomonas litopenaei]MBN8413768.1 VWA domain-containing protein [Halomonas litopenaei]